MLRPITTEVFRLAKAAVTTQEATSDNRFSFNAIFTEKRYGATLLPSEVEEES